VKPADWSKWLFAQRSMLERRAYRLCGDRDHARDLVQDTFERAWRSDASFAASPLARAWLLRVLSNLFLDHCRRRQPAVDVSIAVDDVPAEAVAASRDVRADVGDALSRIPHQLRAVVEAHYLDGLDYCEIAAQLAIPIGTVGSRLSRGRDELRQLLQASVMRDR
jgi:RNA polymerase sigma-70 factor (ECF subfamily)